MFDAVMKSFKRYDPALVIIQTENAKTYIHDNTFSYIHYFSQDPRFKKIWSQYHFEHQINQYAFYKSVLNTKR